MGLLNLITSKADNSYDDEVELDEVFDIDNEIVDYSLNMNDFLFESMSTEMELMESCIIFNGNKVLNETAKDQLNAFIAWLKEMWKRITDFIKSVIEKIVNRVLGTEKFLNAHKDELLGLERKYKSTVSNASLKSMETRLDGLLKQFYDLNVHEALLGNSRSDTQDILSSMRSIKATISGITAIPSIVGVPKDTMGKLLKDAKAANNHIKKIVDSKGFRFTGIVDEKEKLKKLIIAFNKYISLAARITSLKNEQTLYYARALMKETKSTNQEVNKNVNKEETENTEKQKAKPEIITAEFHKAIEKKDVTMARSILVGSLVKDDKEVMSLFSYARKELPSIIEEHDGKLYPLTHFKVGGNKADHLASLTSDLMHNFSLRRWNHTLNEINDMKLLKDK